MLKLKFVVMYQLDKMACVVLLNNLKPNFSMYD